jgi:hypothetical protein
VSRSVRIASLAVLAVLAVACTSSGGGQTITGSPIVSILSTQGPVNIGQNNKIEFHLLAGTSVGALRSRECPGEASQCWPDAGNPTGMLYLVRRQATFARNEMARSSGCSLLRFRQAI